MENFIFCAVLLIILSTIGSSLLHIIRQVVLSLLIFSFFLNNSFQSVVSTLSFWYFKIPFVSFFYEFLFQYCTVFFILGQCETDGFDSQHLAIRYAFLSDFLWCECSWRLLSIGVSLESCLKSVGLVFISQCFQKVYIFV